CGRLVLPTSNGLDAFTDLSQAANSVYAGSFQRSELLVSCTFTTRNDGASVAHALSWRRSHTGDVGHDRLGNVILDVSCCFFFSGSADFTDHHDGFSGRIFFEQLQNVDEAGTGDRVTTDTNTA